MLTRPAAFAVIVLSCIFLDCHTGIDNQLLSALLSKAVLNLFVFCIFCRIFPLPPLISLGVSQRKDPRVDEYANDLANPHGFFLPDTDWWYDPQFEPAAGLE